MIWGAHGKGRLAIVADESAFSEDAPSKPGSDNAELLRRLTRWLRSE